MVTGCGSSNQTEIQMEVAESETQNEVETESVEKDLETIQNELGEGRLLKDSELEEYANYMTELGSYGFLLSTYDDVRDVDLFAIR